MKFKFFGRQNRKSSEKKSDLSKLQLPISDLRNDFPGDFIAAKLREEELKFERAEKADQQAKCLFEDGIKIVGDMYMARFNVQTVLLDRNNDFKVGEMTEHVCMIKSNKLEISQYYLSNLASRVFRVNDIFFDFVQMYADEPEKILLGRKFEDSVLLSHPKMEILTEWLQILQKARTAAFFNNRFKPLNSDCLSDQMHQMEKSFSSLYRKESKSPTKAKNFVFLKKKQPLKFKCPNGEIQEVVVERVCHESKTVDVSWMKDGSRFEVTSDLKSIIEINPWIVNNDAATDTVIDTYVLEMSSI